MDSLFLDILVLLGLLFLAFLILAPIFYYFDKEKADQKAAAEAKEQEDAADEDAQK